MAKKLTTSSEIVSNIAVWVADEMTKSKRS